ncbi:MAG TPA: endonuclease/exonuclease/phosphatase family protein [Spirochaetia bacterium]|nr:endonuclease/exonuclease/phosphatase family protein [Spirochaetia bacterium]
MQRFVLAGKLTILILSASLVSCSGCSLGPFGSRTRRVTLLEYNTENLFDDVSNGTEYSEFDPSGGEWSTELFHIKMQHIAEVLRAAVRGGADIVVLEEVENENALVTLNDTYLKGLGYTAHTGESGRTSVTLGLLSRLPLSYLRAHHIHSVDAEAQRDILEARIDCDGEPLVLFLNHWKSKLGGAEATEAERRAAASLLVRRIRELEVQDPGSTIVIAGDLNENWDEYLRVSKGYQTALLPEDIAMPLAPERSLFVSDTPAGAAVTPERVTFYSPWATLEGSGSYYYGGDWETIDHTLLGPRLFDGAGLEYESFSVVRPDFLLTAKGIPLGWSSERAEGYSDHLPILLTLSISR